PHAPRINDVLHRVTFAAVWKSPESGSRAVGMIQQIQLLFGRILRTPVQPFLNAIPIAEKK
ncbi:MAG: hypothetical protein WBF43_00615, partial [Methylocella sp.]